MADKATIGLAFGSTAVGIVGLSALVIGVVTNNKSDIEQEEIQILKKNEAFQNVTAGTINADKISIVKPNSDSGVATSTTLYRLPEKAGNANDVLQIGADNVSTRFVNDLQNKELTQKGISKKNSIAVFSDEIGKSLKSSNIFINDLSEISNVSGITGKVSNNVGLSISNVQTSDESSEALSIQTADVQGEFISNKNGSLLITTGSSSEVDSNNNTGDVVLSSGNTNAGNSGDIEICSGISSSVGRSGNLSFSGGNIECSTGNGKEQSGNLNIAVSESSSSLSQGLLKIGLPNSLSDVVINARSLSYNFQNFTSTIVPSEEIQLTGEPFVMGDVGNTNYDLKPPVGVAVGTMITIMNTTSGTGFLFMGGQYMINNQKVVILRSSMTTIILGKDNNNVNSWAPM